MGRVARGLLDLGEALAGHLLVAGVGVPVRGLVHREDEDDAVDQRDAADQVAQAPVGVHGGGAAIGQGVGDLVGEVAEQRRGRVADRVGDEAGQNPADDHERHAERDEDATLLGGHALGEHRGDHRDAGAHAEAGDQAERGEERQVVRERLRQREQAVEHDGSDQRLLTADLVGHDAADGAAEHHAQQAPRGQRAHERARVRVVGPERMGHEQVGRIDDHEVVAVEDHGKGQQHEHDPRVLADADGVDDF